MTDSPITRYRQLIEQPNTTDLEYDLSVAVRALLTMRDMQIADYSYMQEIAHAAWSKDYHTLKRENAALRDEIHALQQQLPTITHAMSEPMSEFIARFAELDTPSGAS